MWVQVPPLLLKNMIIICTSDTHNNYEHFEDADMFIHTGDALNTGDMNELTRLKRHHQYLNEKYEHVVLVPGNHDKPLAKEKIQNQFREMGTHVLVNQSIEINGISFYGAPMMRGLQRPAWESLPYHDVILTHAPPYGVGDLVHDGLAHIGDRDLAKYIKTKKPSLHIFGHCHEGAGTYEQGPTKLVNAARCDVYHRLVNGPWLIEMMGPYPMRIRSL